jgi:hypothetical protein
MKESFLFHFFSVKRPEKPNGNSETLQYQILVKSMEGFVGLWKSPFMAVCQLGFIVDYYA